MLVCVIHQASSNFASDHTVAQCAACFQAVVCFTHLLRADVLVVQDAYASSPNCLQQSLTGAVQDLNSEKQYSVQMDALQGQLRLLNWQHDQALQVLAAAHGAAGPAVLGMM